MAYNFTTSWPRVAQRNLMTHQEFLANSADTKYLHAYGKKCICCSLH